MTDLEIIELAARRTAASYRNKGFWRAGRWDLVIEEALLNFADEIVRARDHSQDEEK